jgi:hypothetical protein
MLKVEDPVGSESCQLAIWSSYHWLPLALARAVWWSGLSTPGVTHTRPMRIAPGM